MSDPVIVFDGVFKTYSRELGGEAHTALKGVSFELEKGQTLGMIGANGAGKSTSIRLLMDFIRPDEGRISVFGQPPNTPGIRLNIGYLPEVAAFPANLNVLDMLRFVGSSCNLSRAVIDERSEYWLKQLDLYAARKRPLRNYSKGMQQRASFALALISDPDLLILDEPMSGLDPLGRSKIISLIHELKGMGKSILFCSHILEDVDQLVDQLLVLHQGQNLFMGLPQDLCLQQGEETIVNAFLGLISGGDHD